jgi:hypothetical protein
VNPLEPAREPLPPWPEPHGFGADPPESAQAARARKQVASTLFSLAGLQFVCGLGAVALVPNQLAGGPVPGAVVPVLAGVIVAIALGFAALGYWARSQPLPAAVVGLVLYGVLFVGDLLANPQMVMQGLVVKILIIMALVKSVSVAARDTRGG